MRRRVDAIRHERCSSGRLREWRSRERALAPAADRAPEPCSDLPNVNRAPTNLDRTYTGAQAGTTSNGSGGPRRAQGRGEKTVASTSDERRG